MLARIGIYFLVIVLTCSAILGGVYYMQGVEERKVVEKLAAEKAKQQQTREELATRPLYETRPLPYGLAQRPTDTVYVEIPPVRKEPFYAPELGQISQNIFALALTFAAEHELSLRARERFRGHTWPNDKDPKWAPYQTHVVYVNQGNKPALNFMVTKQAAPGEIRRPGSFHFQKKVEIPAETLDDLTEPSNVIVHTLRISEEFSRNDIKQLLLSDGYKGEPIKRTASFTIPDDITSLLDQYHELAQYAAITKLQALLKENGESPELLAALSRACIQFASLTEHLTWPIDRYYKARGLFYAQRMTALYPENPQSKWTMLYALGLGGFHSCALPLFDKYEPEPDKPVWFAALAAFCRFDYPKLTELTKEDDSDPFARYVLALTYLNTWGAQKMATASRFLQDHQDCMRAYDILFQDAPLGVVVSMPAIANRYYALTRHTHLQMIPALAELDGLDAELLEPVKPTGRRNREVFIAYDQLISAIRANPQYSQRPDLQELSELLVQLDWWFAERLNVKSHYWGINTEEVLGPYPQLMAHHYQKDNFALYQDNMQKRKLIGDAFLNKHDEQHYLHRLHPTLAPDTDRDLHYRIVKRQEKDVDMSFYDAMQYTKSFQHVFGRSEEYIARTIRKLSPQCNFAVSHRLHHNPETVDLDKATKQYAANMLISQKIARRYYELGEFQKAIDLAQSLLTTHPDQGFYQILSDSLYYLKDDDSYIDIWKGYLENVNSLGLEQVAPAIKIADYYTRRGDHEAALPYIKHAADTYSGEGLFSMIRHFIDTGKLKEAAALNLECAERYPTSVTYNILNAARMGNSEQLQELSDFMESSGYAINPENYVDLRIDNLLVTIMRDLEQDQIALAPAYFKDKPEDCMTPVLYAIVRFKKDGDRHFATARQSQIALNRDLSFLTQIQRIVTTSQLPTAEEFAKLDAYILNHEHPLERPALRLQLGFALVSTGHMEQGIPYLKNAAASPDTQNFVPHFAAFTLLELDQTLDSIRTFDIDEETTETDDALTKAEYLNSFNSFDRSLEITQKILTTQPNHHRALRIKAVTLRLKGADLPAARHAYQAVLTNEPEAWIFHENLGFLCEQLGEQIQAIEHYKTVIEKCPEYAAAETVKFRIAMLYAASRDESIRNSSLAEQYRSELKEKNAKTIDTGYRIRQALIYSALNNRERFDSFITDSTRLGNQDTRAKMQALAKKLQETFPYKRSDDWAKFEVEFLNAQ